MRNTPIDKLTGLVVPLLRPNIDTDAICPSRSKASVNQADFAEFLFGEWRYTDDGRLRDDFILNDPRRKGASFLVALDNFGCGSSRETAVWALRDYGFRCLIAPSFGSIFRANCLQNGIVPVVLPSEQIRQIGQQAERAPDYRLSLDLEAQSIADDAGGNWAFEIARSPKQMLMNGLDPIGLTLTHRADITDFRDRDRERRPWVYGAARQDR